MDFSEYIKTPEFKLIKDEFTNNHKIFVYKVNIKTKKYKLIIKANDKKEIDKHLEKKYKNVEDYYFIYLEFKFHKYDKQHLSLGGPISITTSIQILKNNKIMPGLLDKLNKDRKSYALMTGYILFSARFIKENNFLKNLNKFMDNIINKLSINKVQLMGLGINFYNVKFA